MSRWLLLTFVTACGRLRFDELTSSDAPGDGVAACTVATCPAGYVVRDGGCYRLEQSPAAWLDAETTCETAGGHLVVEDSVEEHFTIHDLAAGISRVWVGWSDRRGPDNVFQWVVPDAGGLPQSNNCVFGNGEPSAGDAEHCVAQNGANSCPDYQDLDCAMLLPYVCECDGVLGDPARY